MVAGRLLTAEEEAALSLRIQQGDSKAREALAMANYGLVVSVSRRYVGSVPMEDLKQYGFIGLMKAVDRYDPARGYRFSTYAMHWIKQSIASALRFERLIVLPAHAYESLTRIHRAQLFLQERGEEATAERLAEGAGEKVETVKRLLRVNERALSLDALASDTENPLLSRLPDTDSQDPEEETLRRYASAEVRSLLSGVLTKQEAAVLLSRSEGFTLQTIGESMGLTRERIRLIELSARRKIEPFKGYLKTLL